MRVGKRIFKNLMSLSIAELATKSVGLISMIYLQRIILPEGFGIISWANAFIIYFVSFSELGFNVVGPREIAKYPNKLISLVNNITSIKIILSSIAFLIFIIIVYFIDKPEIVKFVLLIAGLNIISNVIMFNWVFQGIEKMEVIAIRQLATSLLNLAGILILVNSPDDIVIAMAVKVLALILNAIWMLLYYIKLFGKISFNYDKLIWKSLLYSALPIAATLFLTGIYNTFGIFLLGIIKTDWHVGIFQTAVMILTFAIVPSAIVQQAFIPQLSKSETIEEKRRFTEKYVLFSYLIGTFITAGFFTFSEYIILKGPGIEYMNASYILKLLMITCVLSYINVSYTAPLLSWNKEKKLFWAILSGAIVNIILNIILIPDYGMVGAALSSIFTEFAVLIGLAVLMYKEIRKIYIFKFLVILIYAVFSCSIGYYFLTVGLHPIVCAIISLIIYIFINFIFKTITVSEIKLYLGKN